MHLWLLSEGQQKTEANYCFGCVFAFAQHYSCTLKESMSLRAGAHTGVAISWINGSLPFGPSYGFEEIKDATSF